MPQWEVKMARPGGGSGVFTIIVNASSPEQAKRSANAQNPGYRAFAVKRVS